MKKQPLLKSLRLPRGTKKPKHKKKVEVFAGFFVDTEMNSHIVLMALSKGISKSKLLREVVQDWLKDKDPINEVVNYFKELKQEYDLSDGELLNRLKDFLQDKDVPEEEANKILKRIKELK